MRRGAEAGGAFERPELHVGDITPPTGALRDVFPTGSALLVRLVRHHRRERSAPSSRYAGSDDFFSTADHERVVFLRVGSLHAGEERANHRCYFAEVRCRCTRVVGVPFHEAATFSVDRTKRDGCLCGIVGLRVGVPRPPMRADLPRAAVTVELARVIRVPHCGGPDDTNGIGRRPASVFGVPVSCADIEPRLCDTYGHRRHDLGFGPKARGVEERRRLCDGDSVSGVRGSRICRRTYTR